jgi:hypothetical protein
MSRGGRDDPERDPVVGAAGSEPGARSVDPPERNQFRHTNDTRWSPSRGLSLPRTPDRQHVRLGRERVRLRDSETQLLATVGAFRVVAERDLHPQPDDVRALSDQSLVESRTVVINQSAERVLVLTDAGKSLLEAHRDPGATHDREQQYFAGLVKPRELAHDAQLYRLFETERKQLEDAGDRVTRVVLDYELKREYHTYVHCQQAAGVEPAEARAAFAREHDLPFTNGRIELPDVRIEYEDRDGVVQHRDLELATEHYSRSQLSGKQTAGFRIYRAAGARGVSTTRKGGTPGDPHLLEWLR